MCSTHVAGVDEPGDVAVRSQLSVDVTAHLAVLPAVVHVHDGHHVPLQQDGQLLVTVQRTGFDPQCPRSSL